MENRYNSVSSEENNLELGTIVCPVRKIKWFNELKLSKFLYDYEDPEILKIIEKNKEAKLRKSLNKIENGEIYVIRPYYNKLNKKGEYKNKYLYDTKGRVYTNFSNLNREFRDIMLLDGKPLIEFDISNCQPLLSTILFENYYKDQNKKIPPNVIEYKEMCESGKFYEYFMEKCKIDVNNKDLRTQFKIEFFQRVFFSMETDRSNYLKHLFKEKYFYINPTNMKEYEIPLEEIEIIKKDIMLKYSQRAFFNNTRWYNKWNDEWNKEIDEIIYNITI